MEEEVFVIHLPGVWPDEANACSLELLLKRCCVSLVLG